MYSSLSLRCFTRFSAAFLIITTAAIAQRPVVILDPGHGGKDPGAAYSLKEKTVNLQLALALEQRLHDLDIDTAITRDRDVYLTLKERAEYASKFTGPKLFVSLHYNAHTRKEAKGVETFFHDMSSRSFALRIQKALTQRTGAQDRGAKQRRNLGVLSKNKAHVAVLIEGGFLSNRAESARIANPAYRDLQARAIAEAIASYVGKPVPQSRRARTVANPPRARADLQITAMRPRATFRRPRFGFNRR